MRVTVFGLGYVGVVSAAHISSLGHWVQCVEPKQEKIKALEAGDMPFYEPGLEHLWCHQGSNKVLVSDINELNRIGCHSIICVGTPPVNGKLETSVVEKVVGQIVAHGDYDTNHTIIIRSTMSVGGCKKLSDMYPTAMIIFMPEFLREGSAIDDISNPSLICIASNSANRTHATQRIQIMWGYQRYRVEFCNEFEEAETLKLACNAWHATKIVFTNEISRMCEAYDANSKRVMDMLCQDKVLNISSHYMKPGFSYGGSCLPKDVSELVETAENHKVHTPLLDSLYRSNQDHTDFVYEIVREYQEAQKPTDIFLLGVAFKSNTDDLRNSEVVSLIYRLVAYAPIGKYKIHIVDPFVDSYDLLDVTEGREEYINFLPPSQSANEVSNCENPMVIVTQDHQAYQRTYDSMKSGSVIDLFNMNKASIESLRGNAGTVRYYGLSW